ncbi:Major sperm protein [Balamuthia mandrillaris]
MGNMSGTFVPCSMEQREKYQQARVECSYEGMAASCNSAAFYRYQMAFQDQAMMDVAAMEEVWNYYKQGCELGDVESCLHAGFLQYEGLYTKDNKPILERDLASSAHYLQSALQHAHSRAKQSYSSCESIAPTNIKRKEEGGEKEEAEEEAHEDKKEEEKKDDNEEPLPEDKEAVVACLRLLGDLHSRLEEHDPEEEEEEYEDEEREEERVQEARKEAKRCYKSACLLGDAYSCGRTGRMILQRMEEEKLNFASYLSTSSTGNEVDKRRKRSLDEELQKAVKWFDRGCAAGTNEMCESRRRLQSLLQGASSVDKDRVFPSAVKRQQANSWNASKEDRI